VAREKDFMKEKDEKKANAEAKKKNVPDRRREKETRQVFSTPFFFVLSFPNQNPRQRERASFCASSFFFLLARSIHSSHFSLVARARAYIYISKRAISTRFTRETRREKEREGKKTTCTRDDDPGGKREEEERKIESFFRSKGRLSESERRREKEREEERLLSSFQTTL
jgi:hypothetical protein